MQRQKPAEFKIGSLLRARCPACHIGRVTEGVFKMKQKCPHCKYDLHPEPGFYMGAMVVGYLLTALLTIPPMIVLKVLNVELSVLVAFPFIEFLFLGTFLMFYCRILWLHLEYRMTDRLKGR